MSESPTISAVVCTLDRGPDIAATIGSMLDQRLPHDRFEVVIVDNGSRPENRRLLERLTTQHAPTVRYVREERRGLSHARNRGIAAARAALIVFADDDARVTPSWLSTYVDAFEREADAHVLGSAVELVFEAPRPDWLADWMLPYLGAFDRGNTPCELTVIDCPRGGNMAFRREVLETVGGFSERFGRRPGSLISLEEVDVCQRAVAAGFRLRYVPGAPLLHLVEALRFEPGWFERRLESQGRSLALFDAVHHGRGRLLARLPGQLRRAILRRGMKRHVPLGYVRGAARLLTGRSVES